LGLHRDERSRTRPGWREHELERSKRPDFNAGLLIYAAKFEGRNARHTGAQCAADFRGGAAREQRQQLPLGVILAFLLYRMKGGAACNGVVLLQNLRIGNQARRNWRIPHAVTCSAARKISSIGGCINPAPRFFNKLPPTTFFVWASDGPPRSKRGLSCSGGSKDTRAFARARHKIRRLREQRNCFTLLPVFLSRRRTVSAQPIASH